VAILDAPDPVTDITKLVKVGVPAVKAAKAGKAAKDGSGDAASKDNPSGDDNGLRARQSDNGFGAFYFPWIKVRDPLAATGQAELATVPPSGHVAGVWSRSDNTRGVHKAPANEAVRGALDLSYPVTREDQMLLNPSGVNCIRFFGREGVYIWGARTLADESSEWHYINVRRLFNMVEKSILNSTRWIVFEPNNESLWKSIRRDITAFLTQLWRGGALLGNTPEEAFFVKCDEETNPAEVIDAGQVVTEIGIAPVKPAEFIVFRISQFASGAETTEIGGA
jgi:phage tail sheath protein FI